MRFRNLAPLFCLFSTLALLWAFAGVGSVEGVIDHSSAKRSTTVAYIEGAPAAEPKSPATVTMDQKGKVFYPSVLAIRVGTQVDFLNSDDFDHNVFSPDGEKYDLGTWSEGQVRSYRFERPGVYTQLCRVHPEMIGYIVVVDTPYVAIADEEGRFRLTDVPQGDWQLKVWNERLRPRQLKESFPVSVTAGETSTVQVSF